ncbi:hypothetical protein M404DRAFT_316097 [Pisolithus tinctorius Marx 270]|uniref:Uncharacterized protein n=1 Tax=Pisolithus tinctorius Marx 270 TaxID=870435 RepID=A0A0C3N326_PISTI|nr:hypothetical protein M404DRAFT_316097 [Pisolithus tinctorius Marx 270]
MRPTFRRWKSGSGLHLKGGASESTKDGVHILNLFKVVRGKTRRCFCEGSGPASHEAMDCLSFRGTIGTQGIAEA